MELNLTNVSIFGEYMRQKFLTAKPPLIKSRRQLFRTHPNTFVGSEIVDWLVKQWQENESSSDQKTTENNNIAASAIEVLPRVVEELKPEDVTRVMQTLADFGILHSLHGDIPFKNDTSLYRFTTDDGSCCGLVEALVKGKRLHETTVCPNCALLQRVCEYGEFVSDKCMRGSDLVIWIIEHGLASHREDAKRVCRLMFDHGVIKPATSEVTEFIDGRPFYLLGVDYAVLPMSIHTFVSLLEASTPVETPSSSTDNVDPKQQHVRQLSGQLTDLSIQEPRFIRRRKNTSRSSVGSDDSGYNENANASASTSPTYESLLTRDGKLTPEALAHPDAPFVKKEMRIYPDAVGYGFIIRGSSPCYVKIVDPESPAGKSGLKAWQYITEINNRDVTRKSHTEIEDLILNGPKCLLMTMMLPKDKAGYASIQLLNTKKYSQASDSLMPKAFGDITALRRQSAPITRPKNLPSAQPWMKPQRKGSDFGVIMQTPTLRYIH